MRSPRLLPLGVICLFAALVNTPFIARSLSSAHGQTNRFLNLQDGLASSQLDPSAPVSFASALTYSSGGYYADSIAVADVNGDGKPDLIVSNYCETSSECANGTVSVLLGNGNGTFQPAVTYSTGAYHASSVAVADVNGDGKPDLLVANFCQSSGDCANGTLSVLLGNGDGTFQSPVTYNSGGYGASSVAIVDVNGDGKPDLVLANQCVSSPCASEGAVDVLLGNGDGTFQTAVAYYSGGYGLVSVATADVNGDGKPDLLVANLCASSSSCGNGSVGILLGNGDGTFQAAVTYSSGGQNSASLTVFDVNGDGKPDLLVANSCASATCNNGTVSVLIGNGDGTFQTAVTYASGGSYPESVAVADVNGDAKPDLLLANDGNIGVLLGNGDGTFQAAVTFSSGGIDEPSSVAVADVNGDGMPDVLVANPLCLGTSCPNGEVGVLLNTSGALVVSTKVLNFGDELVGWTTAQYFLGLKNVGSSQVTVSSISISGDFAITQNSCNNGVKPATHCDVYVTFTPQALGTRTGTLTFVDNATNSPQTVLLTGVGATTVSTATKITASAKQVLAGQPITFTATVTSLGGGVIPDGEQVLFQSVQQGVLGYGTLAKGVASLTTSSLFDTNLPASSRQDILAQYAGDSSFLGSQGKIPILILRYSVTFTMTSNPNPSIYCQPVTFTDTVTSLAPHSPTGGVGMSGNYGVFTLGLEDGVATTTRRPCPHIGNREEKGTYFGDAYNNPAYASVTQTVNPTTTTTKIISSRNPSSLGQAVTFTVFVKAPWAPRAYGSVTFTSGSNTLGTVALTTSGSGSITVSSLPAGANTITATYTPSTGDFLGNSVSMVQTVH